MKSNIKLVIISFAVIFTVIVAILLAWPEKIGCVDHLLLNEQQRHKELLTILMKASEKEHFLSQLEHRRIRYFVEKKNDKDVVFFQNGYAEFVNGDILCWAYHNAQIRIPAIPGKIIYELKNGKAASAEVEKRFGMPSAMDYDKEGNLTFTYIFLRDENAKRTDGTYNAELTLLFEKNKLQDYCFSIIYDLNQKSSSEIFL